MVSSINKQCCLSKDYYGITFPAPATLTGRDGNLANNPYSGECCLKVRMVSEMCWFLNAGHPAIAERAIVFAYCKQLNPSVQARQAEAGISLSTLTLILLAGFGQ